MYCIVLLLLHLPKIWACYGYGGDEGGGGSKPTTEDPFVGLNLTGEPGDPVNRNLLDGYGGFKPPENVEKQWRYWLLQYEQAMKDEEEGAGGGGDGEGTIDRSPGSGWPERWKGLGGGHGGAPAPPWAYEPIDKDRPAFCYLHPMKGPCDESLTRYGFNAITNECEEFTYSGCGENQNNFVKKESCEVACMPMPIAGCEFDTEQYIEDS